MRAARFFFLTLLFALTSPAQAGTNRWTPIGPEGAAIRAIAPSAARQGWVYALTGRQTVSESNLRALFLSRDGGATWEPRSFQVPVELVEGLVADPLNPHRVYLVGHPILVSEDGGTSWRPLLRRGTVPFVGLAIDPRVPERLFALHGNQRVFFSPNGGASWQLRTAGLPAGVAATALLMNPQDARALYVAGGAGVFKTTDQGLHWTSTTLSLDTHLLALAPSRPETLYAYAAGHRLLRSDDGGAQWVEFSLSEFFDRIFSLLVHPTDPRRLLARTDAGLFESRDGAGTWVRVLGGIQGWVENDSTHQLVVDPFDPERLYSGFSTRFVASSDFGAGWSFAHRGLSHLRIESLALSRGPEAMLYAASSLATSARPTLWKSRNQGLRWVPRVPDEMETTSAVAIDPTDFRHVVAAGQRWNYSHRFSETHDGGERWDLEGGPHESIVHMSFATLDPGRVFAVSFSKLYRSTDGGTLWNESGNGLPEPCDTLVCSSFHIRKVIPSPHNAQTVYLLFDSDIYRSSDGGETWSRWGATLSGLLVWDLVVDPTRPGRFYAATELGPFFTRDGGRTWERRAAGLPPRPDQPTWRQVEALALDPSAPSKLVALSWNGLTYRSKNGGTSWQLAGDGLLPGLSPLALTAHPTVPGHVYLSTAAGGLYEARFRD